MKKTNKGDKEKFCLITKNIAMVLGWGGFNFFLPLPLHPPPMNTRIHPMPIALYYVYAHITQTAIEDTEILVLNGSRHIQTRSDSNQSKY